MFFFKRHVTNCKPVSITDDDLYSHDIRYFILLGNSCLLNILETLLYAEAIVGCCFKHQRLKKISSKY